MRVAAVALAALAGAAAPASPAGATAVSRPAGDVLVVGRDGVARGPEAVRLRARTVRVGGRRCAAGARTPLSVLLGTGRRVRLRDYGSCSRRARDAGGLFVTQVGRDRNAGRDGWVYKVGRRTGSAAAADPAGPFGRGGLRAGDRVTWFWCVLDRGGGCQRTLDALPDRSTAVPGEPLRVTVRGHDDAGRGVPVPGAVVRLGAVSGLTGPDGAVTLTVPAASTLRLTATFAGMVPAFPRRVRTG